MNTHTNQTPNQTDSFFERKSVYKECLKLFNIPENVESETLSYTEKTLIRICHEMDAGYEISTDELANILDEENMAKFAKLYYTIYVQQQMW